VPVYFTVQPGGGYLSVANSDSPKGAWLVYPNSFHLTTGSTFDFLNYDAEDKGWFIYGHGKVAPDGKKIVPDAGVVFYELTGAMVGGSGLAVLNRSLANDPRPPSPKLQAAPWRVTMMSPRMPTLARNAKCSTLAEGRSRQTNGRSAI
jgi:hypothetical protein